MAADRVCWRFQVIGGTAYWIYMDLLPKLQQQSGNRLFDALLLFCRKSQDFELSMQR